MHHHDHNHHGHVADRDLLNHRPSFNGQAERIPGVSSILAQQGQYVGISPSISPSLSSGQALIPPRTEDGRVEKGSKGPLFRRTYKACLNCRKRKVKCDFGDVSNPSNPPCVRCRRENRTCVFTESKRGGIKNVLLGRKRKMAHSASPDSYESRTTTVLPNMTAKGGGGDSFSERELHNTTDALEILAHAARNFPKITSTPDEVVDEEAACEEEDEDSGALSTMLLVDSDIVAKYKILSSQEAQDLIDYFFANLHPFYPYIPEELQAGDRLAEMPILLAAITTLASRYYVPKDLADKGSEARSFRERYSKHDKLWEYTQRLISESVWAEASTRSIGTVFAFLLFSEWNPRAIHSRWADYANNPAKERNSDGFSASKRSDRLGWMLIGVGCRLAQDLGLMETNPKVFLATHMSEIGLALRMGRKSMLSHFLHEPLPKVRFTTTERAILSVLQIMSVAHETLYASRNTTRDLLRDGKYLSLLGLFKPHLDSWESSYRHTLDTDSLSGNSVLFDYFYSRLYIYSLALVQDTESFSVARVLPLARYVGIATEAAKEVLSITDRVSSMNALTLAPVRWIVRVVHAAVFLIKSLMLGPAASLVAHKDTIAIIRKAASNLLHSSPDDVHLASRYGTILLNLCSDLAEKGGLKDESLNPTVSPPIKQDVEDSVPSNTGVRNMYDNTSLDGGILGNENLLSMLDMDFDFFMEGTEGLGFVEPLMEGIEQQQWLQQQQSNDI